MCEREREREREGYFWLENVRGHFAEDARLESLSPISLHYKTGPSFQNDGAILKINGQFCPWPLPKLSLEREYVFTEGLYSALEALNKKGNYA